MICLTGFGYTIGEQNRSAAVMAATGLRQAIVAAQIALSANDMYDVYKDKKKIAQRQQVLANEAHSRMATTYWPRELQFLAEFSSPEALETAEVLGARYAGRLVSAVSAKFSEALMEIRRQAPRHATSAVSKSIQDLMLARGVAIANARIMGRMIGFAEVQTRDNLNFDRRQKAIGIGRGLVASASKLYAGAASQLTNIGNNSLDSLNNSITQFGAMRNLEANENAHKQARAQPGRGFSTEGFGAADIMSSLESATTGGANFKFDDAVGFGDPDIIIPRGQENTMNSGAIDSSMSLDDLLGMLDGFGFGFF